MPARIYVMLHKEAQTPADGLYVPLQVGAACPGRPGLPCLRDDTGENISRKNPYYSELTGLYWVWKNDRDSDILGLCHYRRYLLNADHKLFTECSLRQGLSEYDAITTKEVILDHPYREAFGGRHNPADLEALEKMVARLCPDYLEDFCAVAGQNRTCFGNMLIAKRELFRSYTEWLFSLLLPLEEQVDMSGYNDYQKRLYGFLSELLLTVWLRHHACHVLQCDVAVMGEKKETKETIETVGRFFAAGDVDGAARFFMDTYQKRPDILMEASDPEGKLLLLAQMLATFRLEQESGVVCMLERENRTERLFALFRELNRSLAEGREPEGNWSEQAIRVAERIRKSGA